MPHTCSHHLIQQGIWVQIFVQTQNPGFTSPGFNTNYPIQIYSEGHRIKILQQKIILRVRFLVNGSNGERNSRLILIFGWKLKDTPNSICGLMGKKCANSTGRDSLANKPTFQYKILVVLHFNVGHDSQMKGIAIDLLISIYLYIS